MAWQTYRRDENGSFQYDPQTKKSQLVQPGGKVVDVGESPNWSWARPNDYQKVLAEGFDKGGGANAGAQAPAAAPIAGRSYFGQNPTISSGSGGSIGATGGGAGGAGFGPDPGFGASGGSTMNWQQVAQQIGLQQRDVDAFTQQGWSPDEVYQSFQSGAGPPKGTPASKQQPVVQGPTDTTQPETRALQQMGQIDPASEALRQAVAQSYLTPLQQAGQVTQAPTLGAARAPAAGDVQSYLDLYKKIDPTGFAQRQALAGSMSSYLKSAQQEAALGSTLDASTQREVEQATRAGQVARGNVYGTPQLVAEAMARGSAGEARRQQRQQALQGALGQQQSYLGSGTGIGDVANALYQQGFGRNLNTFGANLNTWQAQQAARQQAQGGALSYLGSGQTPYQAGQSYLNTSENRATMAAQGGPQYNPASLGQQYAAQQFPQYGLDTSQTAANWYNLMNAYNQPGAPQKNKTGAALGGAASGALSGAIGGSAFGPVGTVVGGLGGALAGGIGGYMA